MLLLSAGNINDISMAEALILAAGPFRRLLADKGYDANHFRKLLAERGAAPIWLKLPLYESGSWPADAESEAGAW